MARSKYGLPWLTMRLISWMWSYTQEKRGTEDNRPWLPPSARSWRQVYHVPEKKSNRPNGAGVRPLANSNLPFRYCLQCMGASWARARDALGSAAASNDRYHIRSSGNRDDRGIRAVASQRRLDALLHRAGGRYEATAQRLGRYAGGDARDIGVPRRLRQLLDLPCIRNKKAGLRDHLDKCLQIVGLEQRLLEIRTPYPLGALGRDHDGPAGLDSRHRADHSLDRLVERRVERIARAGSDHDVRGPRHRSLRRPRGMRDAGPPGLLQLSGEDRRDGVRAVQRHVDDHVWRRQLCNRQRLLMNGVAFHRSIRRQRRLEEARAVPVLDRLKRRQARHHQLSAAGVARHEVRLDQPDRNLQVGGAVAAVELYGHAVRRSAEVAMRGGIAAGVVKDPVAPGDFLPEHRDQLCPNVGSVRAGCDENSDPLARYAGRFDRP